MGRRPRAVATGVARRIRSRRETTTHATLLELRNELLGKRGLKAHLQRLEQKVDALVRHAYVDDAALPYPFALTARRFQVLSQNEEDGLTLALFRHAGVSNCRFVEIGSGVNGGNSGFFARELGWSGLMVDGSEQRIRRVQATFGPRVLAVAAWVTRENINELVQTNGCGGEIDLLSIDVDGIDYWLWESLSVSSPRIVIMEYNSSFGPSRAVTVPYKPDFDRHDFRGTENLYYGASLAALVRLGTRKGYRLVAVEPRGVNAFFLRDDVAPEVPAIDAEAAYRLLDRYARAPDVYDLVARAGLRLVEVD